MQIKNMSYIIALAEAGTLSAAGKQLGISQPTLSVFLSNLEQELGIDLFLRDKKKLIPTPAGRIYLEAARRILATQEQTLQSIRQLTTAPPMEIRIGVTPLRGSEVVSKIFARFSARYPDVELIPYEASSERMVELLLNGELDFAIINLTSDHPLLEYHLLYEDYMVAVVAADHPVCKKMGPSSTDDDPVLIDLKEFNGERFILQKPEQSSRHYTDLAIAHDHAEPGSIFLLENLESSAQLAAEGYGISFNFYQYMRRFHYPKPVRCFRIGGSTEKTIYSIVTLKGKHTIAPMQELIGLIKQFA